MLKFQDSILSAAGQPVSGASVLVRPTGGTSTSVIYSTSSGTSTRANPLTTDANGLFWFYGTNGRYDLVYSGGGIVAGTAVDVAIDDVPLSNLSELTTASAARTNLGLGAAAVVSTSAFLQTANDLADIGTASNARLNLGLVIGSNVQAFSTGIVTSTGTNTFSAAQRGAVVALASTGQIAPDFGAANNFSLAMTVNTTLATPTNVAAGQVGRIAISQNSTAKTLAYASSFWKFSATATLSTATTAGTVDVITYYTLTSTSAACTIANNLV